MITFKGTATGTFRPFLAEVCYRKPLLGRSGKIFVGQEGSCPIGFIGALTSHNGVNTSKPIVVLPENDLSSLSEGDFVFVRPDGTVSVVWDTSSTSNTIFPTPACDCRCVMCPQPPAIHDEETYAVAEQLVERLNPAKVTRLCVSGGEPTILGDRFIKIMKRIKERFDNTFVMLLTNGKNFSDYHLAREFASIGLKNYLVCISLHSDIQELNDQIAGSEGSFHKTIQGLYNLASLRQKIEIRHVISRLNFQRLEDFSQFLYRNFPFVYHVAMMGTEYTGSALRNANEVWVDPYEYRENLNRAVRLLHRTGIHVSVYNTPLCLLHERTWPFARKSISDWKEKYAPTCKHCRVRSNCSGFFATSGNMISQNIKAIV